MTILEHFAEQGFINLIPLTADVRTGELYENKPFTGDMKYGERNPFEDDYYYEEDEYTCNYDDDAYYDDEGEDEGEYVEGTEEEPEFSYRDLVANRPNSLYELKVMFEMEDVDDEEFLGYSPAVFFGITPSQLKFINYDVLLRGSVPKFARMMKDEKIIRDIPDVQKRIKYAAVCCVCDADQILLPQLPHNEEILITPYELPANSSRELERYIRNICCNPCEEDSIYYIQLIRDYYDAYLYGIAKNQRRERDGEPVIAYELFPKPSHIKDLHDKAFRDKNAIRAELDKKMEEKYDKDISALTKTGGYKRFLKRGKKFSVVAPENCADIRREGDVLNHCVYSYCSRFAEGKSLLFFLRQNDHLDKPYYTMEVGHNEQNKDDRTLYLKQCFTYNDSTFKSTECADFIRRWAAENRLRINCRI